MTNSVQNTQPPLSFDPLAFGFKRLDINYASVAFYERDMGEKTAQSPDFLRLNVYLSKDGDYVTIWAGLFDPIFAEGKLDIKGPADFDYARAYNEHLFKGFIQTDAEAKIIFNALRFEKYGVHVLRADSEKRLVCDPL